MEPSNSPPRSFPRHVAITGTGKRSQRTFSDSRGFLRYSRRTSTQSTPEMSDAKTSWRFSPVRETHRLPESISEMLGRALARTRGHGEHSLAPTSRMNRNGDCDRMKRHHAARVHVLRPFETLARV